MTIIHLPRLGIQRQKSHKLYSLHTHYYLVERPCLHAFSLSDNGVETVIIIDCEAREIMHLVASVCPSVGLSVVSWLNRLTLDI